MGYMTHFTRGAVIALSIMGLTACGGGGGGSTASGGTTATYTGVTTPASVSSSSDAGTLAQTFVTTSSSAASMATSPVAVASSSQQNGSVINTLNRINQGIILPLTKNASINTPLGTTRSSTVAGCTGSYSYTETVDSNNNPISLSMNFSNFTAKLSGSCSTTVLNGTLSLTMSSYYTDPSTGYPQPASVSFSYSGFSAVTNSQTVAVQGTLSLKTTLDSSNAVTGYTLSLDAAYYDSVTGETYKASGFVAQLNSSMQLTSVNGTLYDPGLGSFTITTQTPLTYNSCSLHPDTGKITLTFSNGSVDITPAASPNTCTMYTVTWKDSGGVVKGTNDYSY